MGTYPSENCDESCYYHCTKNGIQQPECIIDSFNNGKTVQFDSNGKWIDFVPQNNLDKPNLKNGSNWRVKPNSVINKIENKIISKKIFIYVLNINKIPDELSWDELKIFALKNGVKYTSDEFEQNFNMDTSFINPSQNYIFFNYE